MITGQLLALVSKVADDAGDEDLAMARVCLLDWLGCVIAGAREPVVERLVADAEPTSGSHPIPGRVGSFGLRDHVLISGASGHALDYDDGHGVMVGHPAVAMLPTLLALGLERELGGEHFLRSIVAAYEAACRIGQMIAPDHYQRGFHATGTVGAMGGAVGAAYMLGFSPGQSATALALAGTRAAGLKASFGTDGKPLHAAWAALVSLTAVRWTERGMTGSADILGHKQGVVALTDSFSPDAGLETRQEAHIHGTTFKQHAACGVTHPSIRAALALRDQIAGAQIIRIATQISAKADDICNIADPQTGLQLKFSLRAVVAMALLGIDTASIDSYSEEVAMRTDLRKLIALSEVHLDPDRPIGLTRIEIDLSDGRELAAVDEGLEALGLEGSRAGVSAKFVALAAPLFGQGKAESLRDAVLLGPLDNLAALVSETLPQ